MNYPVEIPLYICDENNAKFLTGVFLAYTLEQKQIGCTDEIRLLAEKNFRRLYKTLPEELRKQVMAEIEMYKRNPRYLKPALQRIIDTLQDKIDDL